MLKLGIFSQITSPPKLGLDRVIFWDLICLKIFINDLPNYFEETPDPAIIDSRKIDCLLYADDVVIMSTSHDGLQCKLNKLQAFCDDWGIDVNLSKTKTMIFNKTGF
jgi:hypothetical protein